MDFVAVLSAEVVRGACGHVQALGDCPQLGEVVQANTAHKTPWFR